MFILGMNVIIIINFITVSQVYTQAEGETLYIFSFSTFFLIQNFITITFRDHLSLFQICRNSKNLNYKVEFFPRGSPLTSYRGSFAGTFATVKCDLIGQSQYLQPFKMKGIVFSLIVVVNFSWLLN